MLFYVLVLTASVCCLQVTSYPYLGEGEYEEQLESPKSQYDEQIDQLVTRLATSMNFTLTESGIMDKLEPENREMMLNIGFAGLRNYVEYMLHCVARGVLEKAKSDEEVKEFHEETNDDGEYSSESEEEAFEIYGQ